VLYNRLEMSAAGRIESSSAEERRPGAGRTSPAVLIALAFLTLFGLVVRVWGIGYMLPMAKLGDASFLLAQVDMLRSKEPPNYGDPAINRYPFLMSRSIALFPDESRVAPDEKLGLAELLHRAGEPWRQARLVSVFYSLLLIPGTWWLARRFLGDAWALLAAAFVATSLLHVDFSAQEPPHALVTTLILFAILASIRLRRRGDVPSYLLAALCASLSIGALQSGFSVLPAVIAAVVLRERRDGAASPLWTAAALAIVALAFRWFYPFHFVGEAEDLSLASETGERVLMLAGHKIYIDQFNGRGFLNMLHTMVCFDPLLLIAAIAGALFLAVRIGRESTILRSPLGKDMLVVLAHAVPYFLVCGVYARTFERFVLPLLPSFACAGAYGVRSLVAWMSRRVELGKSASIALGAALPAMAAVPAIRLAEVRAAPGTQDLVADWIEHDVAHDERIVVVPTIDLPLFPSESAMAEDEKKPNRTDWLRYQARLRPEQRVGERFDLWLAPSWREGGLGLLDKNPMKYFATYDARYVVLGTGAEPEPPALSRAREALNLHAKRVFRVSPERIDSGGTTAVVPRHPDPGPGTPVFERPYAFWLFDIERMGRTIEVFRLE
jgi:Dolichyl-phosphate-mannose-protein mannosyltransferase